MHNTFFGDVHTDNLDELLKDLTSFVAAGMMSADATAANLTEQKEIA